MQKPHKVLFALLFLFITNVTAAYQDETAIPPPYEQDYKSMIIGYHYNFDGKENDRFHFLELGYQKSWTASGPLFAGLSLYASSEFLIKQDSFLLGPKIGTFIHYGGLILGTELLLYTDFHQSALRFVPYIGFGGQPFQLSINPHIRISNKNYEPINRGSISLKVALNFD